MSTKKKPAKAAPPAADTEGKPEPIILDTTIPPISESGIQITIKDLILDAGTQPREAINQATVEKYRDEIKEARRLENPLPHPAIDVFRDPSGNLYPGNGFHRIFAHQKAGEKEITVNLREGTLQQAILFSLGANSDHGLPRTPKDQQRALRTLAAQPGADQLPNTEWARILNCSEGFVRTHRTAAEHAAVKLVQRAGKTVKVGAKKKKPAKKAGAAASGGTSEGGKTDAPKVDEKVSKSLSKISAALGPEGPKFAEGVMSGALKLTPKDLLEMTGFKPETMRNILPLITQKNMKPSKALDFVRGDLSDKVIEDLHNRALGSGGTFVFEDKKAGVKITVEHIGK